MPQTQPASHSTGPVAPQAQQRSRFSAFRNAVTGQTVVLPGEERGAYEACCTRLAQDLQPSGEFERQLVQTIADATWRLNRAAAAETNMFAHMLHEEEFLIETGNSEVNTALCLGHAFRLDSPTMSNLAMYTQRISRQRDCAYQMLRQIQAERRERERQALEDAAAIRKLHNSKKIPYNPAEDGFVLQISEIDTYIARQQRKIEAREFVKAAAPANKANRATLR